MDNSNTQKCNGFQKEAKLYKASDAADCSLYAGFYSEDEFWCCDLYDAFGGYVCEVGGKDKPAECCYASSEVEEQEKNVFRSMATCYECNIGGSIDCEDTCPDGFTQTGCNGYSDGCQLATTVSGNNQVEALAACQALSSGFTATLGSVTDCSSPEPTPDLSGEPLPTPTPTPSADGCQDDTDCGSCERCNTFNHQCYSIDEVECTDCEECDPSTRSCKPKSECGRCEEGVWKTGCEPCNECVESKGKLYCLPKNRNPDGDFAACYSCVNDGGQERWESKEDADKIRKNCLICTAGGWTPGATETNCKTCDGEGNIKDQCTACSECTILRTEDGSDIVGCYEHYETQCYECTEIDLPDGTKSRKFTPKNVPNGDNVKCYSCACPPDKNNRCYDNERYWQKAFDEKKCETCTSDGIQAPNPKCQECDDGVLIDKYKDSCCYACDPSTGWIYKKGENPPKSKYEQPEFSCETCIEEDYDGEIYKGQEPCKFFDKCALKPFGGSCHKCNYGVCIAEYKYGNSKVEECPPGSSPDDNCECDLCTPPCSTSQCMQCYNRDGRYVCDKNEEWVEKLANDPCAKCLNGQVLGYQEYINHPSNLKEVPNPMYDVCKDPRTACSDGEENEKIKIYKGCQSLCKEVECKPTGLIACVKDKTADEFPNCAGCVEGQFQRGYEDCGICQKCKVVENNPTCEDPAPPDNPCQKRVVIRQQCQTVDKCEHDFPNTKPVTSKIFTVTVEGKTKTECKCVGDFCGKGADEEGSWRPESDYCDPGFVCCKGECVQRRSGQGFCHVRGSDGCTRSDSLSGDSCQIKALCEERGGKLENFAALPCDDEGRPPSSSGGDDVVSPLPSTGGNGETTAPITAAPITSAPIIMGGVTPPDDSNNPIVGPGAGGDNGSPIGNDPPDPGGEVPPQITSSEPPSNPGNPVLPPTYPPSLPPSDPGNPSVPPSPTTDGGGTEPEPPTISPPGDPEYPDVPANATATIPGVNPPTIPPANPSNPELPPTLPATTDYPLPDPPTNPDNPDYPYTNTATGSTTSEPPITDPVACPQDVKLCPDGSYVGRDPFRGCLFDDCPPSQASTSTTTAPYLSTLSPVALGGLGGVGTVSTLPETDMPVVYGAAGTQGLTTGPTSSSSSSGPVILGGLGGTEGITSSYVTSSPTTTAITSSPTTTAVTSSPTTTAITSSPTTTAVTSSPTTTAVTSSPTTTAITSSPTTTAVTSSPTTTKQTVVLVGLTSPAGITTGAYTTSELSTSTAAGSIGPISIAVGGNTSYGGLTLASVGGYDDEFQGLTTMGPVEGVTVSPTAATTTTSPTAATTTTTSPTAATTTTTSPTAATTTTSPTAATTTTSPTAETTTTTSPTAATTTTTSPILSTLTTTTGGAAATGPISLTTVGADPVGLTIGTTSAIPSDVEQEPLNVYIVRPKTGIWRA